MKIGMIGIGVVGGATKEVLEKSHQLFPYDKYKEPYNSNDKLGELAENSEIVFICVPTPMKQSGEIDYSTIHNSLKILLEELEKKNRDPKEILIVIRSTAVSGSTDKFAEEYPFHFVFNPEFLRDKCALEDMKNTDRIIIGADLEEDYEKLAKVYRPIFPHAKYIFVDIKTAEMIKYCANVMLAGQISLANELYQICKATGVDYNIVKDVILLDGRIAKNIDVPGHDGDLGFGGKCFPKDLNALIYLSREKMYRPYLLEEIWRLNERVRKNRDWLSHQPFSKMNILVTGGAGFLGSNLCKFLLEKGNHVICLDDFSTGKRENVLDLEKNDNFSLITHDITFTLDAESLGHIDQIYNLACPASPTHYQYDALKTINVNTKGIHNILELAKLNRATVLQASTSEIYGDPLEHPQKEEYRGNVNTIGPRACYDEGKRIGETFFADYKRKFNMPIRISRIFNTYGPNMNVEDGRVVSNFIVQALKNESLTVYGSGNQTRSFCYVDDLINGLYSLMNSSHTNPINLGNPQEFSILELAKKIIQMTNSKSEIVFKELPQDDPVRRKPEISMAENILNWKPKVSVDDGLKKTIEYFKKKLSTIA
jgi:UDP-glucuronate decarboxylase